MRYTKYAGFHEMLKEYGVSALAEYLEKSGIEYYETCQIVDGKTKPDLDTDEARRLAKEGRFKIQCYTMYIDLWNGDREAIVRDIKYNLRLAKELGAVYYHQTVIPRELYSNPNNPSFEEAHKTVFPYVLEVAKYAVNELGIIPVFEPQGIYYSDIPGIKRMIGDLEKELGAGNVGFLFDVGNSIFADVKPMDFAREFMPYIKHVHLKDYKLSTPNSNKNLPSKSGKKYDDCLLGEGIVGVEECIRYIEENGYKGSYSSEVLVPEYSWEELDKISMKWLDGVLRKING